MAAGELESIGRKSGNEVNGNGKNSNRVRLRIDAMHAEKASTRSLPVVVLNRCRRLGVVVGSVLEIVRVVGVVLGERKQKVD